MDDRLLIAKLFPSIQGEGHFTGHLTYFVRFAGCNLKCKWCDTTWSQSRTGGGVESSTVEDLLERINRESGLHVCITGGEPLIQLHDPFEALVKGLSENHIVSIFTNGTVVDASRMTSDALRNKNVFGVIDYKLPSSGYMGRTKLDLATSMFHRGNYAVKFVVSNLADRDAIIKNDLIEESLALGAPVILTPAYTDTDVFQHRLNLLYDLMREFGKNHNVRIQLQQHKQIGVE
jgi:7-carboxy-7-deazaguanine synthase